MHIKVTRIVSSLLGFVLYGIGTLSYSEPPNVELALQCDVSSVGATQLRITVRNTGSTDTAIVLGTSIGNGGLVANFLVLEVKRDSNSAVDEFHLDLRVMGHVDPWIVPLPAMSEFSFIQPLGNYWSRGGGAAHRRLRE